MPGQLEISFSPERLDEGSTEERATFGLLSINSPAGQLIEGVDYYISGYRKGPLVSAYFAAEWLAWNWWRLRWEGRSPAQEWAAAHVMSSIGEGYVWPNLTIFSDGVRTALISKSTGRPDAKPFRYLGNHAVVVPSLTFESAVDAFLALVIGRLRDQGVPKTNLDRVWGDVLAERSDSDLARRRRIEALLGCEPDEGGLEVEQLVADSSRLGVNAVDEVAAEAGRGGKALSADGLEEIAASEGRDTKPADAVHLRADYRVQRGASIPAWRVGRDLAQAVRQQERLGDGPLSNRLLSRLAATLEATVADTAERRSPISFALDRSALDAKLVLRSRWETGRRFDLARLVGDRLSASTGALHPATRTYTYRQKLQRSFAAELLAPFEVLDDWLDGDYGPEHQQDAAEFFNVSEMTIRTLLVNHNRLEREDLDGDFEPVAA